MNKNNIKMNSIIKQIKKIQIEKHTNIVRVEQSWTHGGMYGPGRAVNEVIFKNEKPLNIGYNQTIAKKIAKKLNVQWIPDKEYQECLQQRRN